MAVWQIDFEIVPRKIKYNDLTELVWYNIKEVEASIQSIANVLIEEKSWSDNFRQFGKLKRTSVPGTLSKIISYMNSYAGYE